MHVSRRDFFKGLGAGAGAALLLKSTETDKVLAASSPASGTSSGKAMLHDASMCTGCRACQTACKQWNSLPAESIGYGGIYDNPRGLSSQTWTLIKARELSTNGEKDLLLCKYQCMHCTEAACVKVCPTNALTYHPLGFVAYDEDKCSGCGYCADACPFQVPHLAGNTLTGIQKMRKCTFCQDRVPEGRQTACAEACPADAILYGDRDELIVEGKKRVDQIKNTYPRARLYGENELGGLHVMYVLKEAPPVYQFPEQPQVSAATVAWKDVIQPVGWAVGGLTILGLGLNYLVARTSVKSGKEK